MASNFKNEYQNLVHRTKSENTIPQTSQEHIYTYDTDKDKRSVPNTPGRKPFKISCIILLVVGIYLLLFSVFVMIRGGYSASNINDINANCRYAMIILSFFVIFMSFTGYSGAYTNWKPIILTFSVLASMGLLGHLYVAKKLLDATRFTQRDMAISWWDVYTDLDRATFQDKFQCCGYLNYNDLPVASQYCLSSDIDAVTAYSNNIKFPADVEKNDSYRKKFSTADSVVDTSSQATTAATAITEMTNDAGAANPVVANPVVANPGVADNGVADPGVADPGVADPGVADPGVADPGVVDNGGFGWKRHINLGRRQNEDLQIYQALGCKDSIVPLVKSRLKFIYLINYALCFVYIAAVALSLYYWQNMRKEKEFDEFA